MKNITLTIGFLLLTHFTFSQVTLPYSTGFDNTSEQNGWVEFKKEATTFSHWNFSSSNSNSSPNCISHEYSPSSGITLTDNWFVSPAFEIESGGNLDEISYMFSGFSVPGTDDTIAIYLLQGSQDPDIATQVLLFDFRNSEYVADNTYRTKENIDLPAFSGLSYLAIRYKNSDCSSNWLTVHFDDITISEGTVGLDDFWLNEINIYPNPTSNEIHIDNTLNLINSFKIIDNLGKTHFNSQKSITENIKLDISKLNNGVYFIVFNTKNGFISKKIIIQK